MDVTAFACLLISNILVDENGVMLVTQIYTAGTETTSTALQWALLYMCLYPDVKEKVHEEIDEQIGNRKQHGLLKGHIGLLIFRFRLFMLSNFI